MTKKDFTIIADVLKTLPLAVRIPLTRIFIEVLEREYPNFDSVKFAEYIEGK